MKLSELAPLFWLDHNNGICIRRWKRFIYSLIELLSERGPTYHLDAEDKFKEYRVVCSCGGKSKLLIDVDGSIACPLSLWCPQCKLDFDLNQQETAELIEQILATILSSTRCVTNTSPGTIKSNAPAHKSPRNKWNIRN